MTPGGNKNRAGLLNPEQAKRIEAFGFYTGEGGAITQATNKSTGVTLDTRTGAITMNNASLAANTSVSFTLTNSTIAATDVVIVNVKSGHTTAAYLVTAETPAAGSVIITLRNITAGALGEAVVIAFVVIKGAIT